QGIALGGEWGGAVLLTVEYAPCDRRGYYGSIVQLGANIGLILATAVLFLCSYLLSPDAFFSWGWRVPFLASAVLLGLGLYIRLKIGETPAFRKAQEAGLIARVPTIEAIRKFPKRIIYTAALYLGGITVPFYTANVFLVYYATSILHENRSEILL